MHFLFDHSVGECVKFSKFGHGIRLRHPLGAAEEITFEARASACGRARAKHNPEKYPWLTQLLARRPFKVVVIEIANKMARIAWALLASRGHYRTPRLAAA
jgi:hypothetical protein